MKLPIINHKDYFAKIGDDHRFPIHKFGELANYLLKKKIVESFYTPYPCSEETLKRAHSEKYIKHIKIKRNQGLGKNPASTLGPNPGLDDSTKNDVETEFSKLTGSAGSRGHMLDMATGAKTGTGSAVSPGLPIQLGEPMDLAWRLLKQEIEPYHLMRHNDLVELVNEVDAVVFPESFFLHG